MTGLQGHIVTPSGIVEGTVRFGERIDAVEPGAVPPGSPLIVPGFVDLHCHGGGGGDVMEGGDACRTVARLHARHGTTSLLATTMTSPADEIVGAMEGAARAVARRGAGEARVLGVHLEGPFIDPGKLGAQPPFTIPGDPALFDRLHAIAPIRIMTWAPEADPDGAFLAHCRSRGTVVQLGHSGGGYEAAAEAFARGASGVTHMFNAMSPLHHRAPGVVGAALAHADHAELIPDLLHVHPGAIRAAMRAIPFVYAVTDATAAAGMPDGDYRLGRHAVRKCDNGVRLEDGTLAGSCLTMDQAFRNLVAIGLPAEDAARRTATWPAGRIGASDRGRIEAGAFADLVCLDADLLVRAVFVEGEAIDLADAR